MKLVLDFNFEELDSSSEATFKYNSKNSELEITCVNTWQKSSESDPKLTGLK